MDGVILFVIILVIAVPMILRDYIVRQKHYNRLFKEIAASLPLKLKMEGFRVNPRMSGNIEGCQIEVKKIPRSKGSSIKVISTKGLDLPGDIHIAMESSFNEMQRKVGIKDIETGDKHFDSAMLLEASFPETLIGLLNVETRRMILELSWRSKHFSIRDSCVTATLKEEMALDSGSVVSFVRLVKNITQNLSKKVSLPETFAFNIRTEPVPKVCINNIRAMISYCSNKPEIVPILREALKNPSREVQVAAAIYLGEEGMDHLVKILETREKSLEPHLLIVIVQTLRQKNFTKSIPVLKALYHASREDELKKEILKAFSTFGDTGLNSFLLAELEKENSHLQLYIIEALGTCGQVEAVEKLYKISKRTMLPGSLRKVKEAIARIQSRLGDVEKGWLSVSQLQDTDGALSIADQPGEGALSIPQKKQKKPAKK